MSTSTKKLYELVKRLPEEKKKEAIDFIEYLHFREVEKEGITAQIVESLKQVKNKKIRPARDLLIFGAPGGDLASSQIL